MAVEAGTLLIVRMQYTLYEIMELNPIKLRAESGAADVEMVTRGWFIFWALLLVKSVGMD
jgi:hypothetical protein